MRVLLAAALALSTAAEARPRRHAPKPLPQLVGLGKSCRKSADCRSRDQRCIKESDANGKNLEQGFCVLPCAPFEAGMKKVVPGAPPPRSKAPATAKKKAPPRCPPRYQCRSAGAGVPIDMCVKE